MVKYKSLNNLEDIAEIERRILEIKKNQSPEWGKMNATQMLWHCRKTLQIATGKVEIPKVNRLYFAVGVLTKFAMKYFSISLPHNLPTFTVLKNRGANLDFSAEREKLITEIYTFHNTSLDNKLPPKHNLFGKIDRELWGKMEYIHLNHHLKQFNV